MGRTARKQNTKRLGEHERRRFSKRDMITCLFSAFILAVAELPLDASAPGVHTAVYDRAAVVPARCNARCYKALQGDAESETTL